MILSLLPRLLLLTLGLGSSVSVLAQVTDHQPPPQLISFFMVGGLELQSEFDQPDKPAQFKFRTANGIKSIQLLPGGLTPAFKRKSGSKVTLYTEKPATEPGQKPELVPVAETEVRHSWNNVLVLVSLDEASGRISLIAMDQSFSALPPASLNFINLSTIALAVKMGDGQGIAPAHGSTALPIHLPGDEPGMVRIQIAGEIDGQAQLLSSGTYALTPKDRRTVLLTAGKSSRIRMTILEPAPADLVDPAAAIALPSPKAK